MAKYYKGDKLSPIIYQLNKSNLTKSDLYNFLGISYQTLNRWIVDPGIIPVRQLSLMAGMFGMYPEKLLMLLIRNKPQETKESKKWFEDNIISK